LHDAPKLERREKKEKKKERSKERIKRKKRQRQRKRKRGKKENKLREFIKENAVFFGTHSRFEKIISVPLREKQNNIIMESSRKMSIGIQRFERLCTENYPYVDKTEYVL
jgi:hypothetical protein